MKAIIKYTLLLYFHIIHFSGCSNASEELRSETFCIGSMYWNVNQVHVSVLLKHYPLGLLGITIKL